MTVSVLLTSYEAGGYLKQAIASVLEQAHEDLQLTVMDDGSSDPLVAQVLADTIALGDPRVGVVEFSPTEEERRASCRYATLINWGASHAVGDYVTYLCGDDYYLPDRLERMVAKLQEGHDVVYGELLQLRAGEIFGRHGTMGVLEDAYERVDLNSVMHTRESFEKAGGWATDPTIWRNADAHFWRRLHSAGYAFVPVDGGPLGAKRYRDEGVDARVIAGKEPWT